MAEQVQIALKVKPAAPWRAGSFQCQVGSWMKSRSPRTGYNPSDSRYPVLPLGMFK